MALALYKFPIQMVFHMIKYNRTELKGCSIYVGASAYARKSNIIEKLLKEHIVI